MTRPSRMVLIVGTMAVIGVLALAMLANRYRESAQLGSVADLPTASEPSIEASGSARPAGAAVEAFVRVRSAVVDVLDRNPEATSSLCDELNKDTAHRTQVKMHNQVLVGIRVERFRELENEGMSEAEYREIRKRYRNWMNGVGSLDREWRDAFDDREQLLAGIDLGRCEGLDY